MSRTVARWLLSHCIAEDRRDAIIGDLEESALSDAQYWSETVMAIANEITRVRVTELLMKPVPFTLLLGIVAGLTQAFSFLSRGDYVLLFSYPVMVLASAFYVHYRRVTPFSARFAVVAGAFMLATAISYYVAFPPNIDWYGHAWRIAMMVGIGSGLAVAIARLTGEPPRHAGSVQLTLALGALATGAVFVGFWAMRQPGFILACLFVLFASGAYVRHRAIEPFARRYAIIAGSFTTTFVLVTMILAANRRGVLSPAYVWRTALLVAAGCTLALLVARYSAPRSVPS